MGHEEYRFHLIYDEETWVGMILLLGNRRLYIHRTFLHPAAAAKPGIRTADAGTSQEKAKKTVILEIDPPVDEISVSRKAFYKEAAGYKVNPYTHIPPRYRKEFEEHSFVVMSWPRELPGETYRKSRPVSAGCGDESLREQIESLLYFFSELQAHFLEFPRGDTDGTAFISESDRYDAGEVFL